jgi:RNA polymerase sigma factor (sigma-70 family)
MTVFVGDHDLLRRFRAGDREALSTVYWHYVGAVDALLRRSLAATGWGWDTSMCADVADIAQEIFVKAFADKARHAYDPQRTYKPFLMSIARNALVDYLRGLSREAKLDIAQIDGLLMVDDAPPTEPLPWTDPQLMLVVEGYVAGLAAPERSVYLERYVHCRSQEHAAAALGMSRQRIRTLENRLRSGLSREVARWRLAATPSRSIPPTRASDGVSIVAGKPSGGA